MSSIAAMAQEFKLSECRLRVGYNRWQLKSQHPAENKRLMDHAVEEEAGTRALPTAELELKGMRAWMIGEEGEGIKQMATVLNIARAHNAVSAISFMRRGLAIAKVCSSVILDPQEW